MANLYWEKQDHIALMTWDEGENRHNPDFVGRLLELFDEIEADREVNAVVIRSADPKNWSLGIDLQWIMAAIVDEKGRDDARTFLTDLNISFKRALTFPVPVIAAITGHAFGDGAIFACACDFRFMRADRGFFCFPEVNISIPFFPGMWAINRKAIPYHKLEEMMLTGNRYGAVELAEHHAITKACPTAEATVEEALAFASTFAKDRAIFAEMKRRANQWILDVIDREDPPLIEKLQLTA